MTNPEQNPPVDLDSARRIIQAFSGACGLDCQLISAKGECLLSSSEEAGCICLKAEQERYQGCKKMHLYGAFQAERLGGRYIYYCPHGFAWCASPILVGGKIVAFLACGPTLIMDLEDYLTSQPYQPDAELWSGGVEELRRIPPYKSPAAFGDLSILLLTAATYLGEHSHLLESQKQSAVQQQHISDTLQTLNAAQELPRYPIAKERALTSAIREGDQAEARRLLNELLGHIIFCTGGDFTLMRTRSVELMSVLSRAAEEGGADLEQVLALNHQFLCESAYLHTTEDLTVWLTHVMERYTSLVFDRVGIKHKDLIYRAIHFLKRRSCEHITMEDVARYVGFSPSYFSKVFKEEMSCTFNHYLNQLRIENSKPLLLNRELNLSDICYMVGFEDQSYFIKVFRKHMGVTPGQYRRRQGRFDPSKEREA